MRRPPGPRRITLAALIAEMNHRAEQAPLNGNAISTLSFGAGRTPSLFRPASIAEVLEPAERNSASRAMPRSRWKRIPERSTRPNLVGCAPAGINRISFGAQSFNEARLKFLGRIHGAAEIREAARMAHRAGFERLNLDFIFAVPGQTVDEALDDIAEAAALGPDHISAYNLTFEEGTAFFTEMRRGRIRPIESDRQAEYYAAVREELPRRGYRMYEISNYAPPGHEARHNLSYWRLESYLGHGRGRA